MGNIRPESDYCASVVLGRSIIQEPFQCQSQKYRADAILMAMRHTASIGGSVPRYVNYQGRLDAYLLFDSMFTKVVSELVYCRLNAA